jgi:hypothetical protein
MTVWMTMCGAPTRTMMAALLLLTAAAAPPAAHALDRAAKDGAALTVKLDEASVLKTPERTATLVVGNPLIADVTVQPGGVVVVTGKGYGVTNLLALDRAGAVLMERAVTVQGPSDNVVVVYRGIERESYSCTPKCERRIMLGDSAPYFTTTLTQAGTLNTQATQTLNQQPR